MKGIVKVVTFLILLICAAMCAVGILDYLLWHPDYTQGIDAETVVLMMIMAWTGAAAGLIFILNLIVYGGEKK